jgi:hypothetical protein
MPGSRTPGVSRIEVDCNNFIDGIGISTRPCVVTSRVRAMNGPATTLQGTPLDSIDARRRACFDVGGRPRVA